MTTHRAALQIGRRPCRPWFARLASFVFCAVLITLGTASAHAADNTFVVNSALDDGSQGTLRWAIEQANAAGAGTQTISIQLTGNQTISLASSLPMLENSAGAIAIANDGAQMVTIDGQGSNRVFFVASGNVTISDVAIVNGAAKGGTGGSGWGGGGGGLGAGGALFVNENANVTIQNVQFDSNEATGGNGGNANNNFPAGGGGGGFGGNGGSSINGGGGGGGFAGDGGAGNFGGGGGGGGVTAAGGEGQSGGGGGGGTTQGGLANGSQGGDGNAGAAGGAAGVDGNFYTQVTDGGDGASPAVEGAGGGGSGGHNYSDGVGGAGGAGGTGGVGGGGGGGGGAGYGNSPWNFGNGGVGGAGGQFGGGGGGGIGRTGSTGGTGGDFGGGGGAGRDLMSQYATAGGNGGFGGGGGGAADSINGNSAGAGGFGGGDGGSRDGTGQGTAGGGGGNGFGGAIFVREGGSLKVIGATTANSAVAGGNGGAGAGAENGLSGFGDGQDLYLMNDVNVTFDEAGSSFSGSISGTGGVLVQGQGTTVFSGANNYSGGTTVNGTSRLQGTTTSLQGTITNNSNVTFDQAFDGTYAGNMTGLGDLYLTGTGSVTLSGTSSINSTQVQGGRLAVNGSLTSDVTVDAGATLGGSGSIVGGVVVDGNAAPGNSIGTLTVTGGYTQNANSTLTIEINDAGTTPGVNNDLLVVDFTTLNGGTVVVVADAGTYIENTTYRFLRSDTDFQNFFADIDDNLADFNAVLGYDFFNGYYWAYFTLEPPTPDYVQYAITPNEFAVAEYLDSIYNNPDPALQDMLDELNRLTGDPAAMRAAFNAMTDQVSPTMATIGTQNTTLVLQQLASQLRGGSLATGGGYAAVGARPTSPATSPVVLVSYHGESGEPQLTFVSPQRAAAWHGWAFGYGLGGHAETDGNAAGLNYGMGGMMVGMERYLDQTHRVGLFGGYQGTSLQVSGPAQNGRINGGMFGGYLNHDDGLNYYTAISGMQFNGYESTRLVQFPGVNQTASADFSGWQGYGYFERGLNFHYPRATWQPYAALQYIYLRQNAYTETGAGVMNLNVSGVDANSLRSLLGARAQFDRGWQGGRLVPEVRALWLHEFLETNAVVTSSFAPIGGGSFVTQGLDLGRDWAVVGGGLRCDLPSGWQLYGNYDAQVNAHQVFHVGSGGLQYAW